MGSKEIVFVGLFLAIVLLFTSEVTARDLAETSTSTEVAKQSGGIDDAKYGGGGCGWRGCGGSNGGGCGWRGCGGSNGGGCGWRGCGSRGGWGGGGGGGGGGRGGPHNEGGN